MTDVIFSFDTEDFTCKRASDGILAIARLLREEGIRGCFNIVGLLAEQLVAWERTDILEELKYHEVEFHSYKHSMHPCINEYTNIEDYQAAYNEVMRQETAGIAAVKAIAGTNHIYAACPPGSNENYVAMYAYYDMGISCYAGDLIDCPESKGVFYCNQLYSYYFDCFEELIPRKRHLRPEYIEKLASRRMVNIYNHPNRLIYGSWWDEHNFYRGVNMHSYGDWEEAVPMSQEEIEKLQAGIRQFIHTLKEDGRFRFRTFGELVEERCSQVRLIHREDMMGIRDKLVQRFYPINEPVSLCISDIFAACVKFLGGAPLAVAGRVFGFLDTPWAITEETKVNAEDVKKAAEGIDLTTFLPNVIEVRGSKLGPADFLYAMLDVLAGMDEVTLQPRRQNIDLSAFPRVANPDLDSWAIFSKEFHADVLRKRTPLQAWTIRF